MDKAEYTNKLLLPVWGVGLLLGAVCLLTALLNHDNSDCFSVRRVISRDSKPDAYIVELPYLLKARNRDDVILVDLRAPEEYAAGRLPDSVNMTYDDLRDASSGNLGGYIIIYGGAHDGAIYDFLLDNGKDFEDIRWYRNGWSEWKSCGLPVERDWMNESEAVKQQK